MKKTFFAILLSFATLPSFAQHYHHYHGHWRHNHGNWVWVAPALMGGIIGYEIARNQQPIIVQQPILTPNNTWTVHQVCSPWVEIQNANGTVTRSRTCTQ